MNVTDIATIIGVIILIYKAFSMTPKEANLADANAMRSMEEVVASTMDRSYKMNERIKALEESEIQLKKELDKRQELIVTLQHKINELENIVDRLSHQVESLGAKPVVNINHKKTGE